MIIVFVCPYCNKIKLRKGGWQIIKLSDCEHILKGIEEGYIVQWDITCPECSRVLGKGDKP